MLPILSMNPGWPDILPDELQVEIGIFSQRGRAIARVRQRRAIGVQNFQRVTDFVRQGAAGFAFGIQEVVRGVA